MAGMPDTVVERANAVLTELESRTPISVAYAPAQPTPAKKTDHVADSKTSQLNIVG